MPLFNSLTGMALTIPFTDVSFLATAFGVALLLGILSGLYPGIVLSSFQPAYVLKSKNGSQGGSFFRNSLVTFQFSVSIFLIIGTIVLYQQMDYLRHRKLGFAPEQVLLLKDVKNVGDRLPAIKEELVKESGFLSGTVSSYFPGPGFARKTPLIWKFGSSPVPENSVNAETWTVDHDYVETLGIEIVEGRDFSPEFPSDSNAVILNETAIAQLGFPGSPIGQRISTFKDNPDGSQDKSRLETREIIGVAKDFNFESLRQRVAPLGLFFGKSHAVLAFRFKADETQQIIKTLEHKWKQLAPGEPFHYAFLDQNFQTLYASEAKVSGIFASFAGLAIIIACLGLFALTAYTAEQRTKEIGIRKVLGASLKSIVFLLTREFGKLILTGFIIASAIAAFGIQWYLEDYAYRIPVSWWIYAGAGVITFLLAFLTMAYQSLMAARSNPVEALKSE
jgi:putative ABC transport system permease protein